MDIIEIPDDDGNDEVISLDSLSDRDPSPDSSDIEYISAPASPRRNADAQNGQDNYAFPSPQFDDALRGYEIRGPYAAAATADGRLPEANWREYMEDGGAVLPQAEQANIPGYTYNELVHSAPPRDPKTACLAAVLAIFPDICMDYVSGLYDSEEGQIAGALVAHILDQVDSGKDYPKAKDKLKSLKRKREVDEDEEAANLYGNIDREIGGISYVTLTFVIPTLSEEICACN